MPTQASGLSGFLSQTDGVGMAILVLLLLMSLATWTLIVIKALQYLVMRRRSARFLATFWKAPSLQAVGKHLDQHHPAEPFSQLTRRGLAAVRHHQQSTHKLDAAGSPAECLTHALRRVIDEETARMESGLAVLASVGSTAPFVGLFGTVWGIVNALITITAAGDASIEKVAGPVGEALIMTAIGLLVAVPAVIFYNLLGRRNKNISDAARHFAYDVDKLMASSAKA